jgi:hypothetical protein
MGNDSLQVCLASTFDKLTRLCYVYPALYLFVVNLIAGLWAQIVLRRIIVFFRRTSIIIFIVSFVIFVSAICLGKFLNDEISEHHLNMQEDGSYHSHCCLCVFECMQVDMELRIV